MHISPWYGSMPKQMPRFLLTQSDFCMALVQAAAALPLVLWTLLAPPVALHMAQEPEEASAAAAAGPHGLPTCALFKPCC